MVLKNFVKFLRNKKRWLLAAFKFGKLRNKAFDNHYETSYLVIRNLTLEPYLQEHKKPTLQDICLKTVKLLKNKSKIHHEGCQMMCFKIFELKLKLSHIS